MALVSSVIAGSGTYPLANTTIVSTYVVNNATSIIDPNAIYPGLAYGHTIPTALQYSREDELGGANNVHHTNVVISEDLTTYKDMYFYSSYLYSSSIDTFNLVIPNGWTFTNSYTPINGASEGGIHNQLSAGYKIYNASGTLIANIRFTQFNNPGVGNVVIACFTRDASVLLGNGERRLVQDLQKGDKVSTKDHGPQSIRWIGSSTVTSESLEQFPHFVPVRIAANTFGEHDECIVSQQHRILVKNWHLDTLYGSEGTLIPAKHLVDGKNITFATDMKEVEYFHILFDNHQLINVDGVWSESFQPGKMTMPTIDKANRNEIEAIFPDIEKEDYSFMKSSRPSLSKKDVKVIFMDNDNSVELSNG